MTPERWHNIEPLLNEALDLSPEQRNEFLTRACHDNQSLRLEIEALLAQEEDAHSFIEEPILPLPPDLKLMMQDSPALTTAPLTGKQLGKYKIRSLLGKGGMGEVYLAYDAGLDREVALKFLPPDVARDPEQTERFKREARTLAKLDNHPNIAVIHDLELGEPTPFLVLEYVPGQTLAERLQQGALPLAEALPLFQQIAAALIEAQKRGIIHRDLKPANIKITPDGRAKVLDFGLAKMLSHQAQAADVPEPNFVTTRSFWTTDRQVIMGTVPYMSPEQTRGLPLDQRTDIWAFGCVLFESLTGQRPFRGTDTFDLFNAIRTHEPDWRLLPANTTNVIRNLLEQCLRKEPEARLTSAYEVQRTLTESFSDLPAEQQRNNRWAWRKPIAMAAALLLLASLGITYRSPILARVSLLFPPAKSTPVLPLEKSLVVLPFKDEAGKIGPGFAKSLQDVLATAPELHVLPFAQAAQANLADATSLRQRKTLGVNLFLSGEVKRDANKVTINFWIEDLQARRIFSDKVEGQNNEYAKLQAALTSKVAAALQTNLVTSLGQTSYHNTAADEQYLAVLGTLQSDWSRESIQSVIASLQDLRKAEGDSVRVLAALSRAYFLAGVESHNDTTLQEAIALAEKALKADPNASEAQLISGQALLYLENFDAASKAFRAVIEKQPSNYQAIRDLAMAYTKLKKFKEAEEYYQSAITHWPNYWGSHNEMGVFHFTQGHYQQALPEFLFVTKLNSEGASGWVNLGNAYLMTQNYLLAENAYREAINKFSDDQAVVEEAYIGWGTAQFYQTRYEDAAKTYQAGLKWNDKSLLLWGNLGDTLRRLAEREKEAVAAYTRAIALLQQEQSVSSQARLAEYYAKRSQILLPEDSHEIADKQKAVYNMRLALKRDGTDSRILFSAVLVYQLTGDQPQALIYAEKALQQGLSADELEQEPDLAQLQLNPAYVALLKRNAKP